MNRQSFDTYVEMITEGGAHEAQQAGSETIEAEHLLLSIAADRESTMGQLLSAAGLDYRTAQEALQREFRQSLHSAGVSLDDHDLPRPRASATPPSRMGQSAKLAFERGLAAVHGRKDARPEHLLLGILQLKFGAVPRALALAGVDQATLRSRVEQSLQRPVTPNE
ncbi:Clp protease N-terminal domain-containing protein [Streptomyces sp. NPDC059455]|uniref:Clp protease N-terminal domain-containing protein n=1 Tax=Streptomyces sp. NPDC059455 TaxID=3346837 RepID=UPI0036A0CA16